MKDVTALRYRRRTAGFLLLGTTLLLSGLAAAQVAPVELAAVERRDIVETLRLTGSLTSPYSARLSPDVEGRIVSLEVDAGARVEKGDLLFRLDDELARLELQQAIAAEHEAEATREAVESRLRPIAMSAVTTIFGLAPLVFIPGEGTELYRGVGAIVLFGLAGAAIVTLTFLPAVTVTVLSWSEHRGPSTDNGGLRGAGLQPDARPQAPRRDV